MSTNSRRSILYRNIKFILENRNIPLYNVRFGSLDYLTEYYNNLFPNRLFLNELLTIRNRNNFNYIEAGGGLDGRIYFINNIDISSYDIQGLRDLISPRLNHALSTGLTGGAGVTVNFTYRGNGVYSSKTFNSFLIRDEQSFWGDIQAFNNLNNANTPDYTYTIIRIKITIIRENAGGCSKRKTSKRVGSVKFTSNPSSSNNCFFSEVLDLINIGVRSRVSQKRANEIRREVGLNPDSLIPVSKAIEIFKKYRKNPNDDIRITVNNTFQVEQTEPNIIREIVLEDEHYMTSSVCNKNKCEQCGTIYFKKHTCNPQKQSFYQNRIKKKGKRYLICANIAENYNNQDEALQYDLETFQNPDIADGFKIHTPYIVGYTGSGDDEFKYIAGENCIKLFVQHIFKKADEIKDNNRKRNKEEIERLEQILLDQQIIVNGIVNKTINPVDVKILGKDAINNIKTKISKLSKDTILYINAFNGANFDHYFLMSEFIRLNLSPEKHIINNGSIINFKYKNIKFFDLCKHLQGSLSQNLNSLKCEIQKGEFDHNKACKWEHMAQEMKMECIKYLKSDVLGMRELYNKINSSIFKDYKVNISSYISTSSLSFDMWKQTIKNSFSIQLPDIKQEESFRKAIRGGRTYKSKHKFISDQYEKVINGECDFNDIEDFVIDADVVSLYPHAMENFKYPVGECIELKENTEEKLTMKGEMGIYYIKYKTNKDLIHSIGGRRDEKGSLKWDLKDNEGWYTSVDIEEMIENGYEVEIVKGYYWEQSEYIFKEYIDKLFKKKQNEKKGTAGYLLAKLYMNSLYGKTIQRPIYTNTTIIKNNNDYWKFWSNNIITEIIAVEKEGSKVWFLTGKPRFDYKEQQCITKPTQIGAFILAYSRRVMLNYMKEANPYFNIKNSECKTTVKQLQLNNDIFYTDTDSLQMHARNARLIKNLGNKNLGGITDDLGDKVKIIRGIWIAPKLYCLEYIDNTIGCLNEEDQLKENKKVKNGSIEYLKSGKLYRHFRGKGLNKSSLNIKQYEKMINGSSLTNTREFQMKKIHIRKNNNQLNIPEFSILHYSKDNLNDISRLSKIVNSTPWDGRNFIDDNSSIPWQ